MPRIRAPRLVLLVLVRVVALVLVLVLAMRRTAVVTMTATVTATTLAAILAVTLRSCPLAVAERTTSQAPLWARTMLKQVRCDAMLAVRGHNPLLLTLSGACVVQRRKRWQWRRCTERMRHQRRPSQQQVAQVAQH